MKIVSSYGIEIKKQHMFDATIKIYREAVSFLINCLNNEWPYIQAIDKAKTRFNFAEKLIHTTKYNTAKYDFDAKFYKFPSYLRRAAIQAALGSVSSYYSNHKNWETNGKIGKEPKLQCDRFCFPAFYRTVMYEESNKPNQCYLKLYKV
jgi:putative transposase